MQVKCGCGNTIKMTKDNTVVRSYVRPIYKGRCPFDHAWVQCKGHPLRYFASESDLKKLIAEGCEMKMAAYPDNDTMEGYGRIMAAVAPKVYKLTKRLDDLCFKFGRIMAAMPAGLLYEELTTRQPKRLPDRWNTDGAPGASC